MENQIDNVRPAFVSLIPKDEGLQVNWRIFTYKIWIEDKWSCFIPAFNIYFSAKDEVAVEKKTIVFTRLYIDNYMLVSKGGNAGKFVRQLNRLGFRAPNGNAMVLKSVLKDNRVPKTKFKSTSTLPESFNNAEVNEMVGDLQMAY